MSSPKVAVIVLHHADYAQRYLEPCYRSLQRQTYPGEQFQIFLVGNGVSDATRAFIARVAPEARTVELTRNRGWTGGNNAAIRIALAEGAQYLVLLNVDTIVDPAWLAALIEAAKTDPTTHIWQSTILLNGTGKIHSVGNRIHYLGYGYCHGYGHDAAHAPQGVMDFASGAAMLVRRDVFDAIGLFRQEYFIYGDDLEFCWRARLAGFHVGLAERSMCHHVYDFTARLTKLYYFQRNRLLTLLTLPRLRTLALTAPCLLMSELVLAGYFVARGEGQAMRGVARYFLRPRTWRIIRLRRRQIHRLRQRPDAAIVKQFAGRIVFAEMDHPLFRYVANPLLACYWALAKPFIVW